jgi:hypothetical protein
MVRPDNRRGRGTRFYAPQDARRNQYGTEGPLPFFVTPRSQSTALRTRLLAAMRRAFSY